MATTVVAPTANQIALAESFIPFVDEAYKAESKSAILDTANQFVRFTGANTVNIYNLDPVGMSN